MAAGLPKSHRFPAHWHMARPKEEASNKAYAIALRVVADEVEQSHQDPPKSISLERDIA